MNTRGILAWRWIGCALLMLLASPAAAGETSDPEGEVVVEAEVSVGAVAVADAGDCDCEDMTVECEHEKKRSYLGDANSGWFHVGGGAGAVAIGSGEIKSPTGRFILGGGGYTFGLYLGGGMELSGTKYIPFEIQGVGSIGVHIPIPVVHPMFGFKAGAGLAALPRGVRPLFNVDVGLGDLDHQPIPSFMVGCQMGVMIREFDGSLGVRLMIEPAVHYYPQLGVKAKEVFLTAAFVM